MTSADRQAIRQMLRFQLQWDREWSCRSEQEQWDEVDRIEQYDQLEWIAAWGGVKSARNRVEARRRAAGRATEICQYSNAGQNFSSAVSTQPGSGPIAVACLE